MTAFRDLSLIDLTNFLIHGELLGVRPGDSEDDALKKLGPPELYEPARKSSPAFVLYGPLEIRVRRKRVTYVGLLVRDYQVLGEGQTSLGDATIPDYDEIRQILQRAGVSAFLDQLMSDDQQTVIVTDRKVHMAFDEEDLLGKVACVWNDNYTDTLVRDGKHRITDSK